MFTLQTGNFTLRQIFTIAATTLLLSAGFTLPAVAKEKYKIDPVTGTKYKADAEMQDLLAALAELGAKPMQMLSPAEARAQPSMQDAVNAVLKKKGESFDPSKLVSDVTTAEATIPGPGGNDITATVYTP